MAKIDTKNAHLAADSLSCFLINSFILSECVCSLFWLAEASSVCHCQRNPYIVVSNSIVLGLVRGWGDMFAVSVCFCVLFMLWGIWFRGQGYVYIYVSLSQTLSHYVYIYDTYIYAYDG